MAMEDVLIVGAGPTGLVLAMELAHYGVPFRIIDKKTGPGEHSRAMVVVPKVLESYQKFGLDRSVIFEGMILEKAVYYVNNKRKAELSLGNLGKGESQYPYVVTFPQDEHETHLLKKLEEYGGHVEWETLFETYQDNGNSVEVTLTQQGEKVTERFSYVIGCDGASSRVRKTARINFDGETYNEKFYVLDAVLEDEKMPSHTVKFSFLEDHFSLFFPLRNKKTTRMIGMFPPQLMREGNVDYEALKPYIEQSFRVQLEKKNWFSEYSIHRRVAENYRKSRIFLAGDAAHIHSPVGGQGMNLGIGDAVNLGWKLSAVIKDQVDDKLLDTYEKERKKVGERVASTTDAVFKLLAQSGKKSRLVRTLGVPALLKSAGRSQALQKRLYRLLSQLHFSYETSPLSKGRNQYLKAGERLPFADGEVFEINREDGWQLQCFVELDEGAIKFLKAAAISIVKRKWTDKTRDKKFKRNGLYLVRPDGYIGWIGTAQNTAGLKDYVFEWVQGSKDS